MEGLVLLKNILWEKQLYVDGAKLLQLNADEEVALTALVAEFDARILEIQDSISKTNDRQPIEALRQKIIAIIHKTSSEKLKYVDTDAIVQATE